MRSGGLPILAALLLVGCGSPGAGAATSLSPDVTGSAETGGGPRPFEDVAGADPGDSGPAAGPKRVFVTRQSFSGIGWPTTEGSDAKCQLAADAAMLGGTWHAWVSTATVNAIDRVQYDGPYVLVDGATRVFNNRTNWKTLPLVPISMAEDGSQVTGGCNISWGGGTFSTCVYSMTYVGGLTGVKFQGSACVNADASSRDDAWTCITQQMDIWPPSAHFYCYEI